MLLNCYQQKYTEAGCDEAGRGCLAGPVFAAAVILPKNFDAVGLNDSKKLNHKQRAALRLVIEKEALAWAVGVVTHIEIDQINILNASFLAMHRAIAQLQLTPQFLSIDGNRFKNYPNIAHVCVVKGDAKYMNIAAASILAKTHRDSFMDNIAIVHPKYDWTQNKGYPTIKHRNAILTHGPCTYHRKTFKVKPIF